MNLKLAAATGGIVFLCVASFIFMGTQHLETQIDAWEGGNTDFLIWYRAGTEIATSERSEIYAASFTKDGTVTYGGFFNPPVLAFLFWPLTLLEYRDARTIWLLVSLASIAGLLAFAWALGLRGRAFILSTLALASFWPLYVGIEFGHPVPVYALLGALALLELEARANASAGGFIGLLALKPSLLVGPLGYVFWRKQWATFAAASAMSAVIFLGPFVVLGFEAFNEFRVMGSKLTSDAFHFADTQITIGSWGLLNWNGYVSSLTLDDPPVAVVLALDAGTVLVMLKVWARGTLREAWFASIAASTLILPHLLAYDWLMLFVPAAALIAERRSWPLIVLLLATHLGANLSVHVEPYLEPGQIREVDYYTIRDLGGFWAVPALFLTMAYLAFRPPSESVESRRPAASEQPLVLESPVAAD